ncbi:MAG: flagellar hook-length control protein FliK [Kordiimonadaceae bacterium]|nr:flagellar hook-length control protein FliK [Kordiimonadaceae bacterium]MBO6569238.1 flagellar hook-length control protein FliK [Kordiimonadaceae bacterium]MBO6964714.1 flagellar hook-length control protein FliK [Kordiimonadaceae bacterium]
MNPVETPMMQLMQAFGATSPQSVAAMFGIQDAAGDIQENYSALFSGYLQSVEGSKPTGTSADIINVSKNSVQPFSAAPEDFSLAVNPVEQILRPVALEGLVSGEEVLAQINARTGEEGELTPERLAAFALAVDYKAAQPVALTPENLQALQSAFNDIQKTASAALAAQPIQVQNQQAVAGPIAAQQTAQFLPSQELMYFFGQETEIPASLQGDAPGILFRGGDIARQPVLAQAAPAPVYTGDKAPANTPVTAPHSNTASAQSAVASPQSAATTAAASNPAGTSLPTDAPAPSSPGTPAAAPQTGAELSAAATVMKDIQTPKASDSTIASVAAKEVSKIASTQKVVPDVVVENNDADVDGQVLTVTQKQAKTPNSALQTPQATAQTSQWTGAEAAPVAAAAAQSVQQSTPRPHAPADKVGADAPKSDAIKPDTPKVDAPKIDAPRADGSATEAPKANTAPAQQQQPVVQAPIRPAIDWTSPWTTPERAAGWADGMAAGLISSGLGSLTGQTTPFGGLGLMGGRPDPLLGKQVAKQVNVNITRAVKAGDNQFAMRMDPPELGRVAVKMTFLANGLVKAQVMAERPETLEMLQREIKGLERAVEAGGHKSEPGGISFSLDSGNGESAGKAFAEAMQEEKLSEEKAKASAMADENDDLMDGIEEEIDLDEILAHVTPETGIDVRV